MAGRTNKESQSWLRRHRADLALLIAAIIVISFAIWVLLGNGGPADASRAVGPTASTTAVVTPKKTSKSAVTVHRPVAVFIGDSYTTGVGSDGTKWTTLLSQRKGWREVNLGYRGTGYAKVFKAPGCPVAGCPNYLQVVDQVVAKRPDIVVVSGGRNDAVDTAAAATNIPLVFQQLRTRLPKTQIIAISSFWGSGRYPAYLRAIGSDVRASVKSVRGRYIDVGSPLRNRSDQLGSDGIYPNAAGQKALAAAVESNLK